MRHVLSSEQYSHDDLEEIFEEADFYKRQLKEDDPRVKLAGLHTGRIATMLFYQASTRTRFSFETAAYRLGMDVIGTKNAEKFSSVSKGETIEDTIRVLSEYGHDIVVIRSNEVGLSDRAAAAGEVSIINGGEGDENETGEHPSQALLDAYTIHREIGRLDDLHIVMGGDLSKGRTVRSLAPLMSKFDRNRITFVSIPELQIEDDILNILDERGTKYSKTVDMYEPLHDADVVYWTRLQFPSANLKEGGYVIDSTALEVMQKKAIILHPLPRVDEIHPEVDADPRAKYFVQAGNGLPVRMALMDKILKTRKDEQAV